jgi:hypothetical protein
LVAVKDLVTGLARDGKLSGLHSALRVALPRFQRQAAPKHSSLCAHRLSGCGRLFQP